MKQFNWEQYKNGVFLVNCLGIVFDKNTKKILIGRREKDPYLTKLTWAFPGGRPNYGEDLEEGLKRQIKIKTGLTVKVKEIIFAKAYPEKKEFISIYYLCEIIGGKAKAGELFVEIKWVNPRELEKYFTTSLHPKLKEYILTLK